MKTEVKISIKQGEIVLKKPVARFRNKALVDCIQVINKEQVPNMIKFFIELLPYAVVSHPFGMKSVRESLEDLETDEYDLLINGLKELYETDDELKKKLEV